MNEQILIVDDDEAWRTSLSDRLRREGFDVDGVSTGAEALAAIKSTHVDLLILDVQLPDQQGYDVCLEIRKQSDYIPIIMISGVKKELIDRVVGLRVGADHYFEKPTEPSEIIAQVHALLRMARFLKVRKQSAGWQKIDEHLSVNFERRVVLVDGENVELTPKEFDLLRYLVEHTDKPCSRADIIDHVWVEDAPEGVSNAAVDIVVSRLRQKIEPAPEPQYILTVHRLGYKFRHF